MKLWNLFAYFIFVCSSVARAEEPLTPVVITNPKQIPVYFESVKQGKARDLRNVFYDSFKERSKIAGSTTLTSSQQLSRITDLEAQLPASIALHDTLIRFLFTRPEAETDFDKMATGKGYGTSPEDFYSILEAIPGLVDKPRSVSPFFDVLYDLKEEYLLNHLRTERRSFYPWKSLYDCDTILNLGKPSAPAGKRILFFQSEMDIDADGSDGDRLGDPLDYSKDGAFQPETSYRWSEVSHAPNPFLEKWKLIRDQADRQVEQLKADRKAWEDLTSSYGNQIAENIESVDDSISKQERISARASQRISDITIKRHLVGELDPFIVVPLSMTTQKPTELSESRFAPSVGDYGLVLYGKKLYPVIVGDEGPARKCGEASLFLAKQIVKDNDRLKGRGLSAESTPFWDLEVSYLVFPGTAEPKIEWGELNLEKLHQTCSSFIEGMGGLGEDFTLHDWKAEPE